MFDTEYSTDDYKPSEISIATITNHPFSTYTKFSEKLTFLTP